MKTAPPDARYVEPRPELWAYLVAAVVLIGGGMLLRTPILNWISGPAIVITCVAFLGPLFARRAKKSTQTTNRTEVSTDETTP